MASSRAIRAARAFVEIFGDDTKLRKVLDGTQKRLQSMAAATRNVGSSLIGAGAATLAPLTAAVFKFAASGDQLDKMSARTGVSSESLSQLGFAAEQSGSSLETLGASLFRMQRRVANFTTGSGPAKRALEDLGFAADSFDGDGTEQQFFKIVDALQQVEDPALRAQYAFEIFGGQAQSLLPLLNAGSDGIAALKDEADGLGLTLTQDQTTAAAAFSDAWNRVKRTLEAIVLQIGAALAPTLTDLADKAAGIVVRVIAWVRENAGLIKVIAGAAAAAVALGSALVGVSVALSAGAAVLGAILSPMGLLIGLAGAAAVALIQLAGGPTQALEYLKQQFPGLSALVEETFGAIKDALNAGEYALAGRILWLTLKQVWLKGVDALNHEWLIWQKAFTDTFYAAARTVEKEWKRLQNSISNGVIEVMAFFDSSIDATASQETLAEDFQRQAAAVDAKYDREQESRDAEFEKNISGIGQELESVRAEWLALTKEARQRASVIADNPVSVTDDRFRDLMDQLESGQLQANIHPVLVAQNNNQDVRSTGGVGVLYPLLTKQGEQDRQQTTLLEAIRRNGNRTVQLLDEPRKVVL